MNAAVDLVAARDTSKPAVPSPAPAPVKRKWEAADTVIAISAGLVVVIVGIFAMLCLQGYFTTLEQTKARGLTAANIVAEETRWVLSSAVTLAQGAGGAFNWDPAQASATSLARFNAVTTQMPTKLAVGVYDASGTIVADASSPGVPRNVGDRDYFQTLAAGESWAISAQEADATTGEAIFAVVRRLGPPDKFLGAVMIAIDASVLEDFATPQNLGANSTISIVRRDGWVIARLPSLTAPLNLAETDSYKILNSADAGSYDAISPVDGVTRIVSYRHVDELGFIALASISTETALKGLWTSIWIVSLLIGPIAIALIIGSFITARLLRRTEATSRSLAAAVAHNELLFREIHHRVKNNLQSVTSLLQMQPIPREIKADMSQRIAAMSAVHEHIYRSNNFATVRVKDYLKTLIENIRAGAKPNVRVVEELEDVAVDKDAAGPLGLILNEVLSNAFKHAFPDGRDGSITVRLKRDELGRGVLSVDDDGVGFDPDAASKGIGRRLITALAQQVHGELASSSEGGAHFALTFPLVEEQPNGSGR